MDLDAIDDERTRRIVVVGTSGAGKTTFARRLAGVLGHRHVELDALHWLPEWRERPTPEFVELVEREIARERWVIDGNYGPVRDAIWARATAVVWIDPPFATVLARVTRRSLRRALRREELWSGNRESLRRTFCTRESIILWAVTTFHRRRVQYAERFAAARGAEDRHAGDAAPGRACLFARCRTSHDLDAFVAGCRRACA